MSKVIEIGICKLKGDKIVSVNEVEAIHGKGLLNDRKCKTQNSKKSQVTLIEVENINFYNKITGASIPAKDFRRNIITSGIKLNDMLNKEFFIGKVKVKGHDLCRPCKYLQDLLNQKNLVKELSTTGGLRCEILTGGKIYVNDKICF